MYVQNIPKYNLLVLLGFRLVDDLLSRKIDFASMAALKSRATICHVDAWVSEQLIHVHWLP